MGFVGVKSALEAWHVSVSLDDSLTFPADILSGVFINPQSVPNIRRGFCPIETLSLT